MERRSGRSDAGETAERGPNPDSVDQKAPAPAAAGHDPLADLQAVIAAIRASSYRYALNWIDSAALRARQTLLRTALLLAAALLLFVVAACGVVFILVGAAQALSAALDAPLWSGLLIVGVAAIVVTVVLVRIGLAMVDRRSLERAKLRIAQRAGTAPRTDPGPEQGTADDQ